jgi:hypothetical protein
MGKLRENLEDLHMNGVIGDWCICDTNQGLEMFLRYPVPKDDWMNEYWPDLETKGDIVNLPLSGEGRPVWQWDGSREAPTLSPSILVRTSGKERWHGFLRAGKLETV